MKRLTDKEWITTKHFQKLNAEEVLRRLWELENGFDSEKYVELPCLRKITFKWREKKETTYELARFNKYGQIITETFSDDELKQAEAKLKELKGEKE